MPTMLSGALASSHWRTSSPELLGLGRDRSPWSLLVPQLAARAARSLAHLVISLVVRASVVGELELQQAGSPHFWRRWPVLASSSRSVRTFGTNLRRSCSGSRRTGSCPASEQPPDRRQHFFILTPIRSQISGSPTGPGCAACVEQEVLSVLELGFAQLVVVLGQAQNSKATCRASSDMTIGAAAS